MTYRAIITPAAETDLQIAYRYIRSQAPRAARDWIRRARQAAKSLARHPERCPMAPESASFDLPIRELFFGTGNRGTYRVFSSLCLRKKKRFTYCMFGTDRCRRFRQAIEARTRTSPSDSLCRIFLDLSVIY